MWRNAEQIPPKKYTCGWCSSDVASNRGSFFDGRNDRWLYYCPNCLSPTTFIQGGQQPGVSFGDAVNHLPPDVESLYTEARNCAAASCYTAAVLICRKLLMNIAVSQQAPAGQTFISYIEYLAKTGFVPPNGRGWVDHIRKKGNEATHEIALMTKIDAISMGNRLKTNDCQRLAYSAIASAHHYQMVSIVERPHGIAFGQQLHDMPRNAVTFCIATSRTFTTRFITTP
jgi:hypothetical protein